MADDRKPPLKRETLVAEDLAFPTRKYGEVT